MFMCKHFGKFQYDVNHPVRMAEFSIHIQSSINKQTMEYSHIDLYQWEKSHIKS